jgi:hypothetical protein
MTSIECPLAFLPALLGMVAPVLFCGPSVWTWYQCKDCGTIEEISHVVRVELNAGRLPWLLAGIPSKIPMKADGVLYSSLSVDGDLGGLDERPALQEALTDELLRRPSLCDKLAEAAMAIRHAGPVCYEDSSMAEGMVSHVMGVASLVRSGEHKEEQKAFFANKKPSGWEILGLYVAWTLAGHPISLDKMTRKNFYDYMFKLGNWYEERRDRLVFDTKSRRLVVKPPPAGQRVLSDEERAKITVRIPYRNATEFGGVNVQ